MSPLSQRLGLYKTYVSQTELKSTEQEIHNFYFAGKNRCCFSLVLLGNRPDFIVVTSEGFDRPLELVGDVQLVSVKEQEDSINAL